MVNWEYEVKCRRCGNFNVFHFSTEENMKWIDFATAMTDYTANPRSRPCEKCEKETVQDLVWYTSFPGNK